MSLEETYFLTPEDLIALHAGLIERFGGLPGVKDQGLLESAAAQPRMEVFGEAVNPEIYDQAAAYMYRLICNNAFHDGNKRIGLHACMTFLEINGVEVSKEQDPWYEFTLSVASGNESKKSCAKFIRGHCLG